MKQVQPANGLSRLSKIPTPVSVHGSQQAAESTLYHLSSKGIWKTFRDAVVVNPEISSGLPLPNHHRYPPPGSRPEKYSTPATKASDPAQNPYYACLR